MGKGQLRLLLLFFAHVGHDASMSLPILAEGRECGECRACCIHLEIDTPVTIAHEAHVPCVRLCDTGCSDYAGRPATCETFRCLWLDGFGDDAHRPDLLGAIFHVNSQVVMGATIDYVAAMETRPGALAPKTAARKAAEEMGYQVPVIMTTFSGKRSQLVPMKLVH